MGTVDKTGLFRVAASREQIHRVQTSRPGKNGYVFPSQGYGLLQANVADKGIGIGGVFGRFKAHLHVALCCEIVDLGWLSFLNDANEICCISHIAVMQCETYILVMWITVKMIDALAIE